MHKPPVYHTISLTLPALLLGSLGLAVTTTGLYAAPLKSFTGSTISSRVKPELIPLGIHQGGFSLFPGLIYGGIYDDNVMANNTDQQSSYVSVLSPSIIAQSNWNAHEVVAKARADIGRNHKFTSEDYDDLQLSIDGIIDINRDTHIKLGIKNERRHIERTAPNTANGLTPTQFTINSRYAVYYRQTGKFTGKIQLESTQKNYDDINAIRSNILIELNQDDRDRTIHTVALKGEYDIQPNYKLTAQLIKNFRDYTQLADDTGYERSSQGHEVDFGLMFRFGNWIFGNAYIGYLQQHYKKPFPDIHAGLISGSLNWNITTLTSIIFESQRSIRETIGANFSGYIATHHTLTFEHELRRHAVLSASIHDINYDYQAIGSAKREESLSEFLLGVTYVANRNLNFTFNYSYLKKEIFDNTATSGEIGKNIYTIKAQIVL